MTDKEAFEAWHGGVYRGQHADIAWAAWQAATLAERERCANERRSAVAHPGLVNIRPAPHATAAMVPTPSVMLTIGGCAPTPDVQALPEDRE